MDIKRINPAALYDGAPFGLSQATVDPRSGLVFVSGQVAMKDGEIQGVGIVEQISAPSETHVAELFGRQLQRQARRSIQRGKERPYPAVSARRWPRL